MNTSISSTLSADLTSMVCKHLKIDKEELVTTDAEVITWAVCDVLKIPMVPIALPQVFPPAYFKRRELWHELQAVPIFEADVLLQVACSRPWDMVFHRRLLNDLQRDVRLVGSTDRELSETLAGLYCLPEPPPLPKDEVPAEAGLSSLEFSRDNVIGWWKRLVLLCRQFGASDIHVAPFRDRLTIRARLRGELESLPPLSPTLAREVLDKLKAFSSIPTNEPTLFHDGKAYIELKNEDQLELRVVSGPTPDGEAMAFRLLDPNKMKKYLGTLPLGGREGEILRSHISRGEGLVIVTGPTGSGKSTTLYQTLFCVDRKKLSVQSVEQPVEYRIDLVNQYEISDKKEFGSATRYLMRFDPDVLLVGEIRDEDTATTCTELALTGHLVFSTLHVTTAIDAVPRLRELGVKNDIIGSVLSLVVAQRLVATLCPTCKRKTPTATAVRRHFENRKLPAPEFVYQRVGCNDCLYLGINGVKPIFELFEATQEIKDMIIAKKDAAEIRQAWEKDGGLPLVCHGLRLVADGLVPYEEVVIYENDRALLRE